MESLVTSRQPAAVRRAREDGGFSASSSACSPIWAIGDRTVVSDGGWVGPHP